MNSHPSHSKWESTTLHYASASSNVFITIAVSMHPLLFLELSLGVNGQNVAPGDPYETARGPGAGQAYSKASEDCLCLCTVVAHTVPYSFYTSADPCLCICAGQQGDWAPHCA